MTKMNDKEKNQMIQKHDHLKKYLNIIKKKMAEPVFYSFLPYEAGDDKYPNLIYAGTGTIFVHIYKTSDMDEMEYHAIEPKLDKNEQIKHDQLLNLIVKFAP